VTCPLSGKTQNYHDGDKLVGCGPAEQLTVQKGDPYHSGRDEETGQDLWFVESRGGQQIQATEVQQDSTGVPKKGGQQSVLLIREGAKTFQVPFSFHDG
jgi:hypothetical protein